MDVHAEIQALAGRFLAGDLPEEEDREVASHAGECEDCAAALEAAQADARAPDPFRETARLAPALRGVAAAAVLAVLVFLGSAFKDGLGAASAPEAPEEKGEAVCVVSPRGISAPVREIPEKALDLSEGSGGGGNARRVGAGSNGGATIPPDPFAADTKLIRHAELQLEADSLPAAQARIGAIVTEEKGFLSAADTQRQPNGKMSGVLTVRVPPERFEAVLERFRELGVVRHQMLQTRDVTKTYIDLEARLGSKQVLTERLKKILAEAKGTVKELMDVEVQIGRTVEEIEALKGELKYYDSIIGYSTIVLRLSERDLGQPFEVVETLQAALGLSVREAEPAYAQAQKIVIDAGGQVTEAQLAREGGGGVQGVVRGRVDARRFPEVGQALRALGHVTKDTVNRRRVVQGAVVGGVEVPVRSELAVIEVLLSTYPARVTRRMEVVLETAEVDPAYQAARRAFDEAAAAVTGGGLSAGSGEASATLSGELDVDRSAALLSRLAALGKVKRSETRHTLPADGSWPVLERARVDLTIVSPPLLVSEEQGLVRAVRATFSGSVAGMLWSVERLFVGISLAGPWLVPVLVGWLVWRRLRRKKPVEPQAVV